MELTSLDKLKRVRIEIQRRSPFFAYLSLYLKFREDKYNQLDKFAGMGVSADGTLIYKKEFVDGLEMEKLKGVILHELLHLSLLHLTRRKTRDMLIWNLACDICVNYIVLQNGFELPDEVVKADYKCVFTFGNIRVEDCGKKTAEQIYEELEEFVKQKSKWVMIGNGNGYPQYKGEDEEENLKGFDIHIEKVDKGGGKGKGGGGGEGIQDMNEDIKRDIENRWTQLGKEALVFAKMKGNTPLGIERFIGELTDNKVAWRTLLQKYIQRAIPYDYSFSTPAKKSMATGYYMPNTIKDYIDVIVAVDTSGSIGQKELKEFLSEIIGVAKAFSNRVRMRLLTHDVKVWDDYLVQNGNIEKIKQLSIKGGGGTSHKEVLDYCVDKIRDTKLLICFTDGDSDIEEIDTGKYRFDKVFVISENGNDKQLEDKKDCHIIKLSDYKYEPQ